MSHMPSLRATGARPATTRSLGAAYAGHVSRPRASTGRTGARAGGTRWRGVAAAGEAAGSPRPALAHARRVAARAGPSESRRDPGEGDPETLRKLQELAAMAMDDDEFDDATLEDDGLVDSYDDEDEDEGDLDEDLLVRQTLAGMSRVRAWGGMYRTR